MVKSVLALSEETRRLTFNERGIYIIKTFAIYTRVQRLHLTPTKMGLALHCHGGSSLLMEEWKRKEIQRGRRNCPHKPWQTSKLFKTCSFVPLTSKDAFPLRIQKK